VSKCPAHHDSTQIHACVSVMWRRQRLGVAVWRCMKGKFRPTSAALDNDSSIFKFYQQSKVMANQFISNDQKVPKKRCGMYGLSPFPSYSLDLSPRPPTVIFSSGMFGYQYNPPSSSAYLMRITDSLSRYSRSHRRCRPTLYSSSV
jgi:hypothetical protein